MEEYAKITRFILTANYKYRVITALQSRCQSLDLTPPLEGVVRKCADILKSEKVEIPTNNKVKLIEFVKSNYPDLRKCINELQKYSATGKLVLPESDHNDTVQLIFAAIKEKNLSQIRKALIENESHFNADYVSLLRNMFNYVDKNITDNETKRVYLLIISEYLYRSAFVVDQEINCYSCFISLAFKQLTS